MASSLTRCRFSVSVISDGNSAVRGDPELLLKENKQEGYETSDTTVPGGAEGARPLASSLHGALRKQVKHSCLMTTHFLLLPQARTLKLSLERSLPVTLKCFFQ